MVTKLTFPGERAPAPFDLLQHPLGDHDGQGDAAEHEGVGQGAVEGQVALLLLRQVAAGPRGRDAAGDGGGGEAVRVGGADVHGDDGHSLGVVDGRRIERASERAKERERERE